jgi:hypothetical protein
MSAEEARQYGIIDEVVSKQIAPPVSAGNAANAANSPKTS